MDGRGVVERMARAALSRNRARRPEVRLGTGGGPPTVYFLAPDFARPSGGVRVMYRHVDILNAAGVAAAALHQENGFRCTWFENSTRVAYAGSTRLGPDDVLVVPELDVDVVAALPRPVPHVVLNQSGHLTWSRATETVLGHYARTDGLLGMITVSRHSAMMMAYAFPQLTVRRARPSIDPAVFHPGVRPRERLLSYLPRRGADDINQVLSILRARGALGGWSVRPLVSGGQREFADSMRSSRIVLSLSYQEGFGLPAAEAMACGNYVIGYHGFGGQEFFRPGFSDPQPTGDVVAVALAVEDAVRRDAEDDGVLARAGREASTYVLAEYSPQQERREVLASYADLLAGRVPTQTASGGER